MSAIGWLIFRFIWSRVYSKVFARKKKRFFVAFNATLRYVDDVLSVNNSYLSSYVNSIYPSEHEIKDNTDSGTSASYFDFIGT